MIKAGSISAARHCCLNLKVGLNVLPGNPMAVEEVKVEVSGRTAIVDAADKCSLEYQKK
jgi:hypothetical protein